MPTYESHVTTSPVFSAPARISYPFATEGDVATKIVHQPLMQLADQYAPPTIGGTFSNSLANFSGSPVSVGSAYCIGDSEPQLVEAGLVSFERTWANIPATRYDYETVSVTFPGYYGKRTPNTQTTMAQIAYEYYRVGAGLTYTTAEDIPLVAESRVTDTNGLNAFILSDVYLNDGGVFLFATTPSTTTYLGYVSGGTFSQVIDSKVQRWMGNIWVRITRRVKAK